MESSKQKVGIAAMEIYFPQMYVLQEKLEEYDGVSKGKYTVGLGQHSMAFHGGNEDSVSMGLTVLDRLMQKFGVAPQEVGRLDVGSESPVDQSKSIKSYLMQYFENFHVYDIQGCDHVNACYSATQALLDACNWMMSPMWNQKLAIVIATDDAVYVKGPARPSGGCGAIALLIAPNAPLVLDLTSVSFYSKHQYDFYKPLDLNQQSISEYPMVDGKLSVESYLETLQTCFGQLQENRKQFDFLVLHSPFNKIVRKGVGRIWLEMTLQSHQSTLPKDQLISNLSNTFDEGDSEKFRQFLNLRETERNEQLRQGSFDSILIKLSREMYDQRTLPSSLLPVQCGNAYNASLYFGLASLLYTLVVQQNVFLDGKSILMYSYGSGVCASLFKLIVRQTMQEYFLHKNSFCLQDISKNLNLDERISQRIEKSPEEFNQILEKRQNLKLGNVQFDGENIAQGVYYLKKIDQFGKRIYEKKE